jgi:MFS family permease
VSPLGPSRGLDAFNFLVAGAQTGFGAFIPVFLAAHAWNQAEIGIVLTIQTATTIVLQIPAGALVDATRRRGRLVSIGVLLVGAAAILLAALPSRLPVALALVIQAGASGVIYPAIAALSLAIAGRAGLSVRLGRNASFAAVGSGVGAASMGALGALLGPRSVFVLAAVMAIAAALCLPPSRERRAASMPPSRRSTKTSPTATRSRCCATTGY